MRPQLALKPDQTVSAVEQANKAAVRALDRSKRVPGTGARKPQMRLGKENSAREAPNTSIMPPSGWKRPQSQPSTAARYTLLAHHRISAPSP